MRANSLQFLAATFGMLLGLTAPLHAAVTNHVTTIEDSGPGSLRKAIADSNPGDVIRFLTNGVITLTTGELLVTNSLTIIGPGATNLAISGNGASRVFYVSDGTTSSISGLTIRDGRTADGATNGMAGGNAGDGAGLYNAGTLTVSHCIFTANRTGSGGGGVSGIDGLLPGDSGTAGGNGGTGGSGGGIYNEGVLTLSGCAVSNNATGDGGRGGNGGIGITSTNSIVPYGGLGGNAGSGGSGGGLYNLGTLALNDCAILANVTGRGGDGGNGGSAGVGGTRPAQGGSGGVGGLGGTGAGIYNHGTLKISGGAICGNADAVGGNGGSGGLGYYIYAGVGGRGGEGGSGPGIGNMRGIVSLRACTLSGNNCGNGGAGGTGCYFCGPYGGSGGFGGSGGGIWNNEGTIEVISCTVSGNSSGSGGPGGYGGGRGGSGGSGGGVANQQGIVTVLASTVCSNVCGHGGDGAPGYEVGGPGGSGGSGGGIVTLSSSNATSSLQNTLVALNSKGRAGRPSNPPFLSVRDGLGVDIAGAFVTRGFNLIGAGNDSTGLTNVVNGDLVGTTNAPINPRLGPLQDNGGPVFTHALLSGSPAIDAGTNSGFAFDARGQPRTIDNPAVTNASGGDGTDIGAFEVNHILTGTETRRAGDDILVRFTTVSDKTYGLEYRPEVGEGSWTELPGIVAGTGGIVTYTDMNAATQPRRFYRIFERTP